MTDSPFMLYTIEKAGDVVYVGITCRGVGRRWAEHRRHAKTQRQPLYSAIRKYGLDAFTCKHIASAKDYGSLLALEVEAIEQFGTFGRYNATRGGEGALGIVISRAQREGASEATKVFWSQPENKARMIEAFARKPPVSARTRQRLSEAGKGRVVSVEAREAARTRLKGVPRDASVVTKLRQAWTPEKRERMSQSKRGQTASDAAREKMRAAWEQNRHTRRTCRGRKASAAEIAASSEAQRMLTDAQAGNIKMLLTLGATQSQTAMWFGVSQTAIGFIARGERHAYGPAAVKSRSWTADEDAQVLARVPVPGRSYAAMDCRRRRLRNDGVT